MPPETLRPKNKIVCSFGVECCGNIDLPARLPLPLIAATSVLTRQVHIALSRDESHADDYRHANPFKQRHSSSGVMPKGRRFAIVNPSCTPHAMLQKTLRKEVSAAVTVGRN
jgi:hypothetical protein